MMNLALLTVTILAFCSCICRTVSQLPLSGRFRKSLPGFYKPPTTAIKKFHSDPTISSPLSSHCLYSRVGGPVKTEQKRLAPYCELLVIFFSFAKNFGPRESQTSNLTSSVNWVFLGEKNLFHCRHSLSLLSYPLASPAEICSRHSGEALIS